MNCPTFGPIPQGSETRNRSGHHKRTTGLPTTDRITTRDHRERKEGETLEAGVTRIARSFTRGLDSCQLVEFVSKHPVKRLPNRDGRRTVLNDGMKTKSIAS